MSDFDQVEELEAQLDAEENKVPQNKATISFLSYQLQLAYRQISRQRESQRNDLL